MDEDIKLTVNVNFILDNEIEINIKNINIDTLNELNKFGIVDMMMTTKWYMYGNYDKITILNEEYTILNKTKKKVDLVRSNIIKVNNAD
jgi:hypothetical protein